jgi:hypothetical protein
VLERRNKGLLARPPEPGFFLLAGLDVMLYDPLAVKRLASAVCSSSYAAKPNRHKRVSRLRVFEHDRVFEGAWP